MVTTPIDLVREFKKLPMPERVRILDIMMREIIRPNPEIDRVWAHEASIRWDVYKKGQVKPIPYEEVISKHKRV